MKASKQRRFVPLAVMAAVSAPLWTALPRWLWAIILPPVGWEIFVILRRVPAPSRIVRLLLFAAAVLVAWPGFGDMGGMEALAICLLVAAAVFVPCPRTASGLITLSLFGFSIILTAAVLNPGPHTLPHMALSVFLVTALMVRSASPSDWGDRRILTRAGTLLVFGIPFMAALAAVFPRFGAWEGLWEGSGRAFTGITDSLYPGTITRLVRDPKISFRAEFPEGETPAPEELYWRGLVLWDSDGLNWFNREALPEDRSPRDRTGPARGFEILMEPQMEKMLFALDSPVSLGMIAPADVRVKRLFGGGFEVPWNLYERLHYRGSFIPPRAAGSDLAGVHVLPSLSPPGAADRERALALPEKTDPRLVALAGSWREKAEDGLGILRLAMGHFATGGYAYTLEPGVKVRSAGEFLFDVKRGFCGHYASALALLLRSAGVPTRVVLGYQGGSLNPLGHYLIVRQHHAHAWVEAWTQTQGWVRADPTWVVAPGRVREELGWEALVGHARAWRWVRRTADFWDGVGFVFHRAVLREKGSLNQALYRLSDARLTPGRRAGYAAGGIVFLVLLYVAVLRFRRGSQDQTERLVGIYTAFCGRMARRGTAKPPHEGPIAYAGRLIAALPQRRDSIIGAMESYADLRYGGVSPSRTDVRALRSKLSRLTGARSAPSKN